MIFYRDLQTNEITHSNVPLSLDKTLFQCIGDINELIKLTENLLETNQQLEFQLRQYLTK